MPDGAPPMLVLGGLVAYLVGAVPIGFLVARAFGIGDIRRHGSGTIGMTNVLRTAGKTPAVLTLIGDVGKGMAAVWLGATVAGETTIGAAVATVAAVIGNCWSVFLGFRGGKGVATGLGALLRLAPLATLAAVPVFLAVVATTRFVSLGSLLGAACVPFGALVLGPSRQAAAGAFAVAIIIALRHRENIARLRAGTESRLGQRSAPGAEASRP